MTSLSLKQKLPYYTPNTAPQMVIMTYQLKKQLKSLWKLTKERHPGLFPRMETYILSFYWKTWRIEYHSRIAKKIMHNAFPDHSVMDVTSNYFTKSVEESAAEYEAAFQTMHSLGDILAQIVNLAILRSNAIDEDVVSLPSVLERIKNTRKVYDPLESFKSSSEFAYISAFCNTIKHRKLLEKKYPTAITSNGDITEGVRFEKFQYNGKWYNPIFGEKVTKKYFKGIKALICNVLKATNPILSNSN